MIDERTLTWGDRTLTITAWAADPAVVALGISRAALYSRIRLGWSVERALTEPGAPRRANRERVRAVDPRVPFHRDPVARAFVEEHPDGATLEEVGAAFGLTRERVRQIEARALSRLLRAAERLDLDPRDVLAFIGRRRGSHVLEEV